MTLRRTPLVGGAVLLSVAALAALATSMSRGGTTGAIPDAAPLVTASATPTAIPTPAPTDGPAAPAPTARPLAEGEEPPQFVVVSFDGGGSLDSWSYWRDIARRSDATMTFFLTGLYLLPESKADLYDPPGFPRGTSEVGFSDDEDVRPRMEHVRQAYLEGHEIGTHYNGHFCGAKGVRTWSAADWADELDQFNRFLTDWRANADATDAEEMPFGTDAIVGQRTPCLEGDREALWPVLAERGFRYDTNGYGALRWPRKMDNGLWDIPLQELRLAGSGRPVLSMDYNFYEAQSGAKRAPAERFAEMREQVTETYRNAYEALYEGNRAPLIIGNHFAPWNDGIYADALGDFMLETCKRPNTRCVSFTELLAWLEAQTPEKLTELRARPVQAMGK